MKTTSYTDVFYVVIGKATSIPRAYLGNEEREVKVALDIVKGMSDNGQPGYREYYGDDLANATSFRFPDKPSAVHAMECHPGGSGWSFRDVRELKVMKVTRKVTTETDEEAV